MPLADIEEIAFGGLAEYAPIDEHVAHTLLPDGDRALIETPVEPCEEPGVSREH